MNDSRHSPSYTALETLPRSLERHAASHIPPLSPLPTHSLREPACCSAGPKITCF